MDQLNVLAIVGSISKDSINRKLCRFVTDLAGEGLKFKVFDLTPLPMFSVDNENSPIPAVSDFKNSVETADGILFVTPEYNRSVPGVLKNALDTGSRPWGKNSWSGKPAGIMGASTGAIATFGAQAHLRNILSFLNMYVMPQPEFYFNYGTNVDKDGKLGESSKEHIAKYLNSFEAWIRGFGKK